MDKWGWVLATIAWAALAIVCVVSAYREWQRTRIIRRSNRIVRQAKRALREQDRGRPIFTDHDANCELNMGSEYCRCEIRKEHSEKIVLHTTPIKFAERPPSLLEPELPYWQQKVKEQMNDDETVRAAWNFTINYFGGDRVRAALFFAYFSAE